MSIISAFPSTTGFETSATSSSTSLAATPASINNLAQDMLAGCNVYSASSTYAVGDKVRYGYSIYKCKTAIATPESWTAAHWEALPSLQAQIDAITSNVYNGTVEVVS